MEIVVKRAKTPQKWKKYEKEAAKVVKDWIERAQYENDDWYYHIHLFAAEVYNRGDGLVFIDFNEKTQKSFMRPEFKKWMNDLLDSMSRLPFY